MSFKFTSVPLTAQDLLSKHRSLSDSVHTVVCHSRGSSRLGNPQSYKGGYRQTLQTLLLVSSLGNKFILFPGGTHHLYHPKLFVTQTSLGTQSRTRLTKPFRNPRDARKLISPKQPQSDQIQQIYMFLTLLGILFLSISMNWSTSKLPKKKKKPQFDRGPYNEVRQQKMNNVIIYML